MEFMLAWVVINRQHLRPVCPALHSFISFTSSISFTSNSLRTPLRDGRSSTPLQSIPYALFLSRRGCVHHPLFPERNYKRPSNPLNPAPPIIHAAAISPPTVAVAVLPFWIPAPISVFATPP